MPCVSLPPFFRRSRPLWLRTAKRLPRPPRPSPTRTYWPDWRTPYDYFGPLDENSVPAAVGYENAVERLHVARMYDEEGDSLHNVIFKNADGSRTQYLFDYPVKYVTETGEIADIRLRTSFATRRRRARSARRPTAS